MLLLIPLIEPATVSVAVMVCEPARVKAALNVLMPLVRVLSAGKAVWAFLSLLVKWTVPP